MKTSQEVVEPYLRQYFDKTISNVDIGKLQHTLIQYINPDHDGSTRIVSLVGGAGSGKTTLGRKLVRALVDAGFAADSIGTDDYNKGDRQWRWEHFEGNTPRDPMGKWDFSFMNDKVAAIKQNRTPGTYIKVPTYDQATGMAIAVGEAKYTHLIGPVDVLIVEGDMARVEQPDSSIFIHAADEHRLQNRVGRDLIHRSESDAQKIVDNFWLRHRNQHVPYTLPAVESADVVVEVRCHDDSWTYDVYRRR